MFIESGVAGGRTPAGCYVGLSLMVTLVVTLHTRWGAALAPAPLFTNIAPLLGCPTN